MPADVATHTSFLQLNHSSLKSSNIDSCWNTENMSGYMDLIGPSEHSQGVQVKVYRTSVEHFAVIYPQKKERDLRLRRSRTSGAAQVREEWNHGGEELAYIRPRKTTGWAPDGFLTNQPVEIAAVVPASLSHTAPLTLAWQPTKEVHAKNEK